MTMIDDDTNSIKSVSLSNEIMDTNKTDSKESLIETSKNNIIIINSKSSTYN